MQAFLGPRYGNTVARVVGRDAAKEYAIDPAKSGAHVTTGNVLAEGAGGLTCAVILLVRRQLANMAQRVGARMVGAVLARRLRRRGRRRLGSDRQRHLGLPPWRSADRRERRPNRVIPRTRCRSSSPTRSRTSWAKNVREISAKTADRVVEIWQEFRRAHAKVLALAEANPKFRAFMEQIRPGGRSGGSTKSSASSLRQMATRAF